MRSNAFLNASALALSSVLATPALAADDAAASDASPATDAATSAAAPAAAGSGRNEIVVIGTGQTRQVQGLTAEDIAVATPGTSPLAVLSKLPSVNFQSASPLGTNEWTTRISVRGFTQNQLGFTLDGVPLGDMSYSNFNGLHISRAITSDNIGMTELSQGAGALSTASSSNLGGTIAFESLDPSYDMGLTTAATFGSNDAWRLFARFETGDLGGGVRAYVSGTYSDTPKWKGKGSQELWQINSKLVAPMGDRGELKIFANYSEMADADYADLTPDILDRHGYDWDYLRYDFETAQDIASNLQNGVYVDDYEGYGTLTGDDAYYDGYGLRKDLLIGMSVDYDLTDELHVRVSPYYHNNRGIGTWWTPYVPTPGGSSLSVRGTEYFINRMGVTGSLSYDLFRGNQIEVGGWYEINDYDTARDYFGLDDAPTSSISHHEFPKNPFAYDYFYKFDINTYQYYVQDTWELTDSLKVSGGWKGIQVDIDASNDPSRTSASWATQGSLTAKDMFLPQVGINYRPIYEVELFGSYAENMRAFTTTPFITSPDQFAAIREQGLKPETSKTFEGGLRFHLPKFEASLVGYHVKFDNRLFSVSPCSAIESCPSVLNNVGSVTTKGVEVTGQYRVTPALSLYAAYAYTDASYDDDVLNGAGELVAASGGKSVVDQPEHLINGEISYDDGTFIGRAHVNYQSKRYATYENDLSFKGRALVDLTVGYRVNSDDALDGTEIQLNVTNVTDEKYVSTIGQSGGYQASYAPGDWQYFMVGAPRQWFVTLKKAF
ncbi:TonB-dependent receptor [Novosphingobium mangrovi (ex Hu et al. 2023)]|uniref:TonB-dependent receptor n=1 Tax=Novosphingobium mangrovi (ex Hu et al. 2023) TaxID=2930094 RepID=A0ABT0AE79_9SPHN|nr:TonB-dependent receptor [Novosphingobium mangrovi (ex Hu et al. 2023)]MCJ1961503.1 TonB-dependent receptor [Novosphingobium mangrovi (ex Hu et al. 2023)]